MDKKQIIQGTSKEPSKEFSYRLSNGPNMNPQPKWSFKNDFLVFPYSNIHTVLTINDGALFTKKDQTSGISSPRLFYLSLNDIGLEIQLFCFVFWQKTAATGFRQVPGRLLHNWGTRGQYFYSKLITETGSHTFMYDFCLYKKELDSVFLFYFLSIPSFPIVLALRWAPRRKINLKELW